MCGMPHEPKISSRARDRSNRTEQTNEERSPNKFNSIRVMSVVVMVCAVSRIFYATLTSNV